jgi:hypothetical protein
MSKTSTMQGNPYHEPAGSSKGGQFAHAVGAAREAAGLSKYGFGKLKPETNLYHSTNENDIRLSTNNERLIPNSISFSSENMGYAYGNNVFMSSLKPDAKILDINVKDNFYDFGPPEATPLLRGQLIFKYAIEHGYNVIRLSHVPGVSGVEYAVIDPDAIETTKLIMKQ